MFSANQKPFVSYTRVTSFVLVLQVCTRVIEELHSFLSRSELSNFFVYIINHITLLAICTIQVKKSKKEKENKKKVTKNLLKGIRTLESLRIS